MGSSTNGTDNTCMDDEPDDTHTAYIAHILDYYTLPGGSKDWHWRISDVPYASVVGNNGGDDFASSNDYGSTKAADEPSATISHYS